MKILVLNSGSSSIKYRLFDMTAKTVPASGVLEKIGEAQSRLTHHTRNRKAEMEEIVTAEPVADHRQGFQRIGAVLSESGAVQDNKELFGITRRGRI
jgi:acetate kinase